MRVLSFIFAFVAALGLVAALPTLDLDTRSSVSSPVDTCKSATVSLTTYQQQLAAIASGGSTPSVDQVNVLLGEATHVLVVLTADIKAVVEAKVAIDVSAVVIVVLELLAVVIAIVQAVLQIALLLVANLGGIVAAVKLLLAAILALVAEINILITVDVVLASVCAVLKVLISAVVQVCVNLGVNIVL